MNITIQPKFAHQKFNDRIRDLDCKVNGTLKGVPIMGLGYAEIYDLCYPG